jgi:hypothetical protein
MTLNDEQMLANALFFEKMFRQLKEGGVWNGDDGMLRKCGDHFYADQDTYITLKEMVPSQWFNRRVILFAMAGDYVDIDALPMNVLSTLERSMALRKVDKRNFNSIRATFSKKDDGLEAKFEFGETKVCDSPLTKEDAEFEKECGKVEPLAKSKGKRVAHSCEFHKNGRCDDPKHQ